MLMKEKIEKVVRVVLGLGLGVFIGRSLWLWRDVSARPELYEANSAPWYTPLLIEGGVLAALILLGMLVLWLLGRRKDK